MSRLTVTSFALGLSLAGCSLPLEDSVVPYENACTESSDCGANAACVATAKGNVCAAKSADLGPVYLEVRTSNASDSAPSFLFTDVLSFDGTASDLGVVVDVDLQLPHLVEVTGSYEAPPGTSASCMSPPPQGSSVGTIPVKVELRAITPLPGVKSQIAMLSKLVDDQHVFEADVPPGSYDVYIEPKEQDGCTTTAPPRYFPAGLVVPTDVAKITFAPRAEVLEWVVAEIEVPEDQSLDGWHLDVVEPAYGRPISNQVVLGEPNGAIITTDPITYNYTKDALLRLQKPKPASAGATAESEGELTVHWVLKSLDFANGNVQLFLRDLDAMPFDVTATAIGPGNTGPVAGAKVTIQSKKLTGSANQNASYKFVTETNENGLIEASLIEGTYYVSIVPSVPGVGMYFGEWDVNELGGGNGKGFELSPQPVLQANVVTAGGDPTSGAPVLAAPSLSASQTYFDQFFGPFAPLPRQATGAVNQAGNLSMAVDVGTLDFSVQINSDTGFPWYVRPRLGVQDAVAAPKQDLGDIKVAYPAVVIGSVHSLSGSSALALIRAWVPAGEPTGDDALSAPLVQIGSTIADEAGNFVLPLPPSVTKSQ
ncbi:MAG: hypothetical protein HOV80_29205 [Polyangiaceae bacterium]|nr:hypothetical protein [Polyangiaceae bacterium]